MPGILARPKPIPKPWGCRRVVAEALAQVSAPFGSWVSCDCSSRPALATQGSLGPPPRAAKIPLRTAPGNSRPTANAQVDLHRYDLFCANHSVYLNSRVPRCAVLDRASGSSWHSTANDVSLSEIGDDTCKSTIVSRAENLGEAAPSWGQQASIRALHVGNVHGDRYARWSRRRKLTIADIPELVAEAEIGGMQITRLPLSEEEV
jgi:hypothetical protein